MTSLASMRFGKRAVAIGLTSMLVATSACGVDGDGGGARTLTVASGIPAENFFVREYFEPFLEQVEEATDGSLRFDHFAGGQLGSVRDAVNTVATGVADVSYFNASNDPGSHPITAGLISMPGLYPSAVAGSKAIDELSKEGDIYAEDYERNGLYPLMNFATPPYEIWSTERQVSTPGDMQGLRIRNTGGAIGEYLNFVGANPSQIEITEAFGALDSGVIEAMAVDAVNLESFSLAPLINQSTRGLGFSGATFGYIISLDVYESLTDEQRQALDNAAAELVESYGEYQDQGDRELKDGDAFAHMEFTPITDQNRAVWRESYDAFNGEYIAGRDDRFRDVYEKFTQRVS